MPDAGNGAERQVEIRADDFAWLSLLSTIIEQRAFSIGMERLGETIETLPKSAWIWSNWFRELDRALPSPEWWSPWPALRL